MSLREMWLLSKLRSADTVTRESLARDPRTPVGVLDELGRDSAPSVRLAVASHPNARQTTVYTLGHDEDEDVRAAALTQLLGLAGIGNSADAIRLPGTSPRLLAVIAEDLRGYSTELQGLCGTGYDSGDRPRTRPDVLAELAKARNPAARAEVAKSRFSPPHLLDSLVGDPDENVRVAVAGNPSAKRGALDALLKDPAAAVRRQLAAREDLPATHLTRLAHDSAPDVRRTAAGNENTPDETLVDLASDPDAEVRLVVARGAQRVLQFGIFDVLEDGVRNTPDEALRTLARDGDPRVRMAVASNPRIAVDSFVALASDSDANVRNHVARVIELGYRNATADHRPRYGEKPDGPMVPTDYLLPLADVGHPEVRRAVAAHPHVPADLLARLLDDKQLFDWDFADGDRSWSERTLMPHSVLYERTWQTNEEWRSIAGVENPQARLVLAYHNKTPRKILEELANDPVEEVRATVLQSPRLSASVLRRLMDDPSPAVATKAAGSFVENASRFDDDLELFVDADSPAVRATVAGREHADPELLERLAGDASDQVRAAVAGNSSTPARSLAMLAADPSDGVIDEIGRLIGQNVLPSTTLEVLAAAEDPRVRAAVAVNRNVPDTSLRALVNDPDESVRRAAAASGYHFGAALTMAIGGDQMARQFGVGREKVATLVDLAMDASTMPEALHSLAQSPFTEVRAAVAAHPSVTSAIVANLTRDKNPGVRAVVARSTIASQEVLTILASDDSVEVRRGVAANPNTPPAALAQLDRDADDEVALAVATHPNTEPASLDAIIQTHNQPKHSAATAHLLQMIGPAQLDMFAPGQRQLRERLLRSDTRWTQGPRQAVATNPHASVETLLRLSQQPDTAGFVALNPRAPTEALAGLANSGDELAREGVAGHPNTPAASLALLALDRMERVRLKVASNRRTPMQTLELLASDFSAEVQAAARRTLSTPSDAKLGEDA